MDAVDGRELAVAMLNRWLKNATMQNVIVLSEAAM
jgi:hypothetical protein